MEANSFNWVDMSFWGFSSVGTCCLVAGYQDQFRNLLQQLVLILYTPLDSTLNALNTMWRSTTQWMSRTVAYGINPEQDDLLQYTVKNCFCFIVTLLALGSDWTILVITLAAMGTGRSGLQLPFESSWFLAMSLVASTAFWGWVLMVLKGADRYEPWEKMKGVSFWGSWFTYLAFACVISGAMAVMVMAYFRLEVIEEIRHLMAGAELPNDPLLGQQVTGGEFSTQGGVAVAGEAAQSGTPLQPMSSSSAWPVKLCMVLIPGISLATSIFGALGLKRFIRYPVVLLVLVCLVATGPLYVAFWLLTMLVNAVFNALQALLELMIRIGESIINLVRGLIPGGQPPPDGPEEGTAATPPGAQPENRHHAAGAQPGNPGGENSGPNSGQASTPQEDNPQENASIPEAGFNPYARR